MIKQFSKIALAVALGVGAIASTAIPVNAMPIITGQYTETGDNNILPIDMRDRNNLQGNRNWNMNGNRQWSRQRYGDRCRYAYGNCRHYYRGYYYQTPWWTLPLVVGGALAAQNNDYGYSYGSSHVRSCYARYKSYDARTNTYLGNDGQRHICR
jgi:hypothetical protein